MILQKTIRLVLIIVLALGVSQAIAGLQATSVLLPATDVSNPPASDGKLWISADGSSPITPTSIVHLSFAMQELPADARIDRVTLRLEGRANNANPQLARVFTNPQGQGDSLGKWTATGNKRVFTVSSDALRQAVAERHRSRQPLDLWLRSISRFSDWSYASTKSYDDKPGAKPRLAIAYSRDLPAPQATDRTLWRFYGEKNRFRVEPLRVGETLLSNPVFFGNSLYLFAKPDATGTDLLALNTNGRERWRSGLQQTPGGHAAVDPDGRLHAIGRERVTRYDLERRGAVSGNTSIKDLKPSVTPTMGLDGSLYFSVYGYLYGLNPRLQEVWRYPQDKREATFSPLALSSTGQAQAFVLARLDNKNYLTTIDTGSGQWDERAFDEKYSNFHPPVVIPDERGDYVCMAANSQQDGLLACHAGGRLIWSRNGPVSRPLASADGSRLYVVRGGCLKALDRLNGQALASYCQDGLAATSNLVLDGDGKVYFWNNGSLLSFDSKCNLLTEQELRKLAENLQLLFSPNGTLYAANPETRQLAYILPAREFMTINPGDIHDLTVYEADQLKMAANTELPSGTRIILKACDGIAVAPGFSVRKGASVGFETGYCESGH